MINNAKIIEDSNGQRFFGENGAAGCIFLSQKTGRLMLGRRSENVLESGTWGTWGGAIEEGSNPRRTAYDEMFEETGYEGAIRLESLYTFSSPDGSFKYHNFVAIVDDEFEPWASHESDGHKWFEAGDWPEPLHFGMFYVIGDATAMDKINDLVQRAKAGEDLLKDAPPPERTLYHCLYREPEGEVLNAGCEREVNGRMEKFLFATPHLTKALAFSFSYHGDGEIICNGSVDGTPDEYAIICNRSVTMDAPRDIRVLAFSSENFERAWDIPSRQYVSTQDLPFAKTKQVFEATSLDGIMAQGLQIFSTEKTVGDLEAEGFFDGRRDFTSSEEWLHSLTKRPDFIWENEAREINPNSRLVHIFSGLETVQPQSVQKTADNQGASIMKFYHASPAAIEGDTLNPGTRNIEVVPQADGTRRARFIEYGDGNAPYLFATDNPQLSMTYTVPKGTRLGNMHGHGGAEILFLDQESEIGDPDLKGGMYNFESGDFAQIHKGQEATDQWVSASPVNLKQAEFTPVRSFNDIMRAGVQIYQVSDDYSTDEFYEEWRKIGNDPDGSQNMDFVKNFVQSGKLRWMNEERGINPVNCLEVPEATMPKPDNKKSVLAP